MTIEYKDSKRIVGLSTDNLGLSFEDDFNTNDWDDAGTRFGVNTTTEKFDFDAVNDQTNDASVYDLGSGNVSDTAWVLRAELNFSTIDYGEDCFFYIVMSGSNQSAGETTNQKFIGTRLMEPDNATKRYDTVHGTASNLDVLADNQYYTFLENTPYFVEIIRTGSDTFTVEIFTVSFGGTSLGKISTSGISGVTGLQFIKFANRMSGGGSGQFTGTIDNVEFYNGITSLTNKPTNVQDNSIMVEKDTARRYWFDADPTYTTVEAGATADSNGGAAYVTYKQITGLTAGDEISHVTFDVYSTPTDTSFKGGVYTDSSNNPTTLLASGELTNQNVSNTYTTLSIPLTSNATVPSDGKVWVAIIPNKTNPLLRVSTSSSSYTNSKFSTTSGSYTNYSNWMLSTASVQGSGENNVRFGVKIYHAPAWTMQPTKQFDFSSSAGWTTVGSNITITGGAITASAMVTQTDNRIYYDLGSALSDKFVIDFDHYADSSPAGSYWQMFALTDTTAIPRTDDGIYPLIDMGSWDTYLRYSNEGSETNVGTLGSLTEDVWQYVRFVRDGTTGTLTVYSDSARTDQVLNVSGTIPATVTGLRYFQSGALSSANTGTATYKIDNLKIYNGVTTPN